MNGEAQAVVGLVIASALFGTLLGSFSYLPDSLKC